MSDPVVLDGKVYPDVATMTVATHPDIPDEIKRLYVSPMKRQDDADEMAANAKSGDFQSRFLAANVPDQSGIDPSQLRDKGYQQLGLEDRRNQSFPDMLSGFIGEQFTKEKAMAILQHPLANPAQTMTANQPVEETPMSTALGMPSEALRKAAGAFNPSEGTQVPDDTEKLSLGFLKALTGTEYTPEMLNKGLWQSLKDSWKQGQEDYSKKTDAERRDEAISIAMSAGMGTIAGVTSKALDKAALYKAQNMELDMAHPDDIHEATGFFRGADTRWRYEIPDQKASLRLENLEHKPATPDTITPSNTYIGGQATVGIPKTKVDITNLKDLLSMFGEKQGKQLRLGDILDHPELYKAYPWLQSKPIFPLPNSLEGKIGGMAAQEGMYLGTHDPELFKSIVLHEAQHYIQDAEKFARGGSPREFTPEGLPDAQKFFEKVRVKTEDEIASEHDFGKSHVQMLKIHIEKALDGRGMTQELSSFQTRYPEDYQRLETIVQAERLLRNQTEKQAEQYRRLMGEVEARNVQTRMNYNQAERDSIPPYRTEDRSRFLQVKK